ncbi:hypothetical protein BDY24DRAFT_373874 [Mrakia frigida]|uniref:uncharacterized protein n=1 Tax=Mrakia frigida TaxID=29902 RepID=UPI003FCC0DCC
MPFASSLILPASSPSTTTSSSSSTSNFLRKLILRRPNNDMSSSTSTSTPSSSSSSSSSSSAQPQQVRIVHRPAAPSLGPLSRPHSEWRAERSSDEEYRGRSGRRKEMRFNLPTPTTPVPIPTSKIFTSSSSSSTHDLSSSQQSSSSSLFEPSSPPTSSPLLSLHSIQTRLAAARSTSHSSSDSGSSSGSDAAFFDDDDEDEEDFDSSASSSAFSFIDGEEMEGLERKSTTPQDVMVRRASTDSQEEVFEQNLYFARKPSLVLNSHQSHLSPTQSYGFSLPALASLPKPNAAEDELSFLSRQAQAKGARKINGSSSSWQSSGTGSFAISL